MNSNGNETHVNREVVSNEDVTSNSNKSKKTSNNSLELERKSDGTVSLRVHGPITYFVISVCVVVGGGLLLLWMT